MLKTLLIAAPVDPTFLEAARADGRFNIIDHPVWNEDELFAIVPAANVLVTRSYSKVTRRVLANAPHLEVIAQATSGIDNVDRDAAAERGVTVLHMPGVNADAVAELVLGFMISMTRTIPFYTREVVQGRFNRDECETTRHELRHFRLGIAGFGHVGTRVAKFAEVFGMEVQAYDPYVDAATVSSLDELLATSDILTLHVPLTHETRKMIGAAEIRKLKRGSYLINASRGEVLDQKAALQALKDNHLAGLALDVFDPEPPDTRLPDDPRLVLTPHVGGCSYEVKSTVGVRLFEKIAGHYATR